MARCRHGLVGVPQVRVVRGWSGQGRVGSAGRGAEVVESGDRVDGNLGPGGTVGQVQDRLPGGAGDRGGDREQAVAEPFGFPTTGVVAGEGEHPHPGEQVGGQCHDGAPDLVGREAVQGQIP